MAAIYTDMEGKLLRAAKLLRNYCNNRLPGDCTSCPLDEKICSIGHAPGDWNIEKWETEYENARAADT